MYIRLLRRRLVRESGRRLGVRGEVRLGCEFRLSFIEGGCIWFYRGVSE